jgi:hypothetical protein
LLLLDPVPCDAMSDPDRTSRWILEGLPPHLRRRLNMPAEPEGPVTNPTLQVPANMPSWVWAVALIGGGGALGGGSFLGANQATVALQADVAEMDRKIDALMLAFARAHPEVQVDVGGP